MSWKVVVFCQDCGSGQDPDGCFDGDSQTFEERFATKEEAEAFAERQRIEVMSFPWQYDVEEEP